MARMTDVEIAGLVDKGRKLKESIDDLEIQLDKIKAVLRGQAKTIKTDHFLGKKHFCRVSPQTATICSAKDYFNLMDEQGRRDEFFDSTKVLIGEAKKLIGDTVFESISLTESEAYKKVSFLKAIPKKYKQ